MTIVKNQWQNPFNAFESPDILWKDFVQKIRAFGFDSHITYGHTVTRVRETTFHAEENTITGKANEFLYLVDFIGDEKAMVKHLLHGNFVNKDPIAYHVSTYGTTALLGIDFLDKDMANYQDAKDFWIGTKQFLNRNALVIPFTKNNPLSPSGFAFHSTMEPDDLNEMADENIEQILLLCHQFMPRYQNLYRIKLAVEAGITSRQLEILNMVCFGLSNAEISQVLDITEATVSFHLAAIKEKLQINSNREIPLAAVRLGFVEFANA